MASRQEVFSLMSDSDDSLLGADSPIFGARTGTGTGTGTGGATDATIDQALQASIATYAVEEERRRSFEGVQPSTRAFQGEDSDDDDEEDLEVLPPSEQKYRVSARANGPRLSISGGEKDPVKLADDSSDDDSGLGLSLRDRLAAKSQTKTASVKPEPAAKAAIALDDSSDDDSDVVDSCIATKPLAHPPPKPAPLPTAAAAASKPSSSIFEYDSSDSEDSLAAMRQKLQPSQQPPPRFRMDSSDDDESLDARKPAAKPRGTVKNAPVVAVKAKPTRKRAAPVDKEQKEWEKLERAGQRLREREEKQAAKQVDKENKAFRRKHQQVAKQAAKHAEKNTKKRRRDEVSQATGKFAPKEIAVLMERDLFRHSTWNLVDDVQEAGYAVQEYPSGLGCKAVQWIRKDFLKGGSDDAIEMLQAGNADEYEHIPTLAVVFDVPHDFINLLEREAHDDEDDYPKLERWLRGIQFGWHAAWKAPANKHPRIILLLHKVTEALDRLWINYRKRNQRDEKAPPTAEELGDAITWMLIQFQVECIHCQSAEDVSHNLKKMTRLLSERRYIRQVTELECIKKLKSTCSDMDPPYDRSKDSWFRQLQQVPQISLIKARTFTRHYPTARSLWMAYQDDELSINEKRLLVADCFDESRQYVKLSDWLYQIMNSEDPDKILR